MKLILSYLPSAVAIVVCAGLGSLIAHMLVAALDWQGLPGTFATLLLSMLLAFMLFALGVFLRNSFRRHE